MFELNNSRLSNIWASLTSWVFGGSTPSTKHRGGTEKKDDSRVFTNRAPSMSMYLSRDDCDLILKGAVVMGCGGGGPLHFAREIIAEIDEDGIAALETPQEVQDDDWMAMIALVGTPSKVHRNTPESPKKVRSRKISAMSSPRLTSSPWTSPRQSPRASPITVGGGEKLLASRALTKSLDNLDGDARSPRPSFYELVRHVMRVKFLCNSAAVNYEDGDAQTPCNAARNTLLYLQKQCQLRSTDFNHYTRFAGFKKIKYVLTGELGAVNMATALYLSASNDVAIIDCDGAGRSVPLVNQITYADNFPVSPTAIMSPQPGPDFDSIPSVILDFPYGAEKMVEEVAGALLSDDKGPFHPYIGYGSYVINGEQMANVPVFGSYTTAFAVGRAVDAFSGHERACAVSEVLTNHGRPNEIVFHGKVTEKVLQNSKVKDTGHIVVTSSLNDKLQLFYKNEIILAGRPGHDPIYMAPDSICILPAYDVPMDISTIPVPTDDNSLEVYVLVVQADEKIKTQKVIRSFESIFKVFKNADERDTYHGEYREWLAGRYDSNHNKNRVPNIDETQTDDVIKAETETLQMADQSTFF